MNPLTASGTPDFLASSSSGELFYLDATIVRPKTFRDSPSEIALFDDLNKLNCVDFSLCIRTRGTLSSTPPMRKTIHDVQAWIDSLDYESVQTAWSSSQQLPIYTFKHFGWTLYIEAMPRGPDMRGKEPHRPIGLGPMRVDFIDSVKPVISAVHAKANKYRNLRAPFVVAINALDLAGVDRTDTLKALFGWESSTDDPNVSRVVAPKGIRKKDCIWGTNKNTWVSAVLLFHELQHSNMTSVDFCIYENPWASYAIPAGLRRLPHGLVKSDVLSWRQGDSLRSLLHLPEGWPGPK